MKNSLKAILYRVVMIKKVQSLGKAADTGMSEQKKKKKKKKKERESTGEACILFTGTPVKFNIQLLKRLQLQLVTSETV